MGVFDLLGKHNRETLDRVIAAMRSGENIAETLGNLMTHAQSLFDKYAMPACPQQLTSPILHKVLSHESIQPHVFGGKGVGSQGDGTAQFVAKSEEDQQRVVELLEKECNVSCMKLTIGRRKLDVCVLFLSPSAPQARCAMALITPHSFC